MADRRTLEELKLLLALSRAAEEKFFYETIKPQMGTLFLPSAATLAVDKSIRARFPKPKQDPKLGTLGGGSTNDYLLAYPEAAAEYKAAEAKERAAEKKAAKLTKGPEKAEKKNPFLRHRRRLVAQQLRQFKASPEGKPGAGRQAGKFEILRLLQERPRHSKNPIQQLATDFFDVAQEEARAFEEALYGEPDWGYEMSKEGRAAREKYNRLPQAEKDRIEREHEQWARKHAMEVGDERRSELEKGFFKHKSQITPRRLRRMTDKDLDNLIATKFRDPRIVALLMEEKRLRMADEFNRNLSRRIMVGKIGKGVAKPSSLLTSKVPTGSGGENAARFALRILTRGRSR